MASKEYDHSLDDFEFDLSVLDRPTINEHPGFFPMIGRGMAGVPLPNLVSSMGGMHLVNEQPSMPQASLGQLPSRGRASLNKTMETNWRLGQQKTRSLEKSYGVKPEIHSQLRQATGAGYSNDLIERTYGDKTEKCLPIPAKEENAQFDDADQEETSEGSTENGTADLSWLDKKCAENMAKSPPKVAMQGHSKKKGKKGREYRRVLLPSTDIEFTSDDPTSSFNNAAHKKTISHIFENKPDYLRSYNSRKKDPFLLQSKDDFPAL